MSWPCMVGGQETTHMSWRIKGSDLLKEETSSHGGGKSVRRTWFQGGCVVSILRRWSTWSEPSFEQVVGLEISLGPFQCVLAYYLTRCLLRISSVIKVVVNSQILPFSHLYWHWCYRPSLVHASLLGYIKEAFMIIDLSFTTYCSF